MILVVLMIKNKHEHLFCLEVEVSLKEVSLLGVLPEMNGKPE